MEFIGDKNMIWPNENLKVNRKIMLHEEFLIFNTKRELLKLMQLVQIYIVRIPTILKNCFLVYKVT